MTWTIQPLKQKAPALVTEADASQLSAVIDAAGGKNLVIQGPPGTGKSQAITNIIANALWHGKTVLFVSEKMAALKVVKDRLDNMDLGAFCLAVHSAKASKSLVLKAIRERMESPRVRSNARGCRTGAGVAALSAPEAHRICRAHKQPSRRHRPHDPSDTMGRLHAFGPAGDGARLGARFSPSRTAEN